ncbi:putative solute carrier family 35 member f6 [Operophtera brumata]|uniref:Putative solute carrier family 35 member f6 n=1 Tax=Operophtera brumata TaxID=104452 RepID=A0A0L7LH98_OPEBR|nr:putative solute carrier family 35 member f6 [Operophtera brumata]
MAIITDGQAANFYHEIVSRMAWTSYQKMLAIVMVITGSINSLSTKWADKLESKGSDGAAAMFVGEMLCLLTFKIIQLRYRGTDGHALTRGNQKFNPFILMPAAMFDLMFRGSIIVFVAVLSMAFLDRTVIPREWLGISLNIPPLQAVGWEGVFGFSVLSVLLVVFYWIPAPPHFGNNARGTVEDVVDGLVQIGNNPLIMLAILGTIVSIAFFNFAGISAFHWPQLLGFGVLIYGMCEYNGVVPSLRCRRAADGPDDGEDESAIIH